MRFIFPLLLFILIVIFIGFNLNYSCGVSLIFKSYSHVPVFFILLIAFILGMLVGWLSRWLFKKPKKRSTTILNLPEGITPGTPFSSKQWSLYRKQQLYALDKKIKKQQKDSEKIVKRNKKNITVAESVSMVPLTQVSSIKQHNPQIEPSHSSENKSIVPHSKKSKKFTIEEVSSSLDKGSFKKSSENSAGSAKATDDFGVDLESSAIHEPSQEKQRKSQGWRGKFQKVFDKSSEPKAQVNSQETHSHSESFQDHLHFDQTSEAISTPKEESSSYTLNDFGYPDPTESSKGKGQAKWWHHLKK